MWSFALLPLIVGLATATNISFKTGTKYEYQLSGRTLTGLSDISAEYSGVLFKCKFTLQAKNDGASLIGRISDVYHASVLESLPEGFNSPIPDAEYKSVTSWMDKPFQIIMKNGIVKDLIADGEIPSWQANLLKGIVSQLQIDTQGENLMESTITQLPEGVHSSGVYKTMEDTVSGVHETLYEINPLPEYKLQVEPYLVPFEELRGDGKIIEIVKTKNFSNAAENSGFYYGLGEMGQSEPLSNKLGELILRDSITRVILTGELNNYTIQHSITINKIAVSPMLMNNNQKGLVVSVMNMTLSNVQQTLEQPQELSDPTPLGDLVYTYEQHDHTKHNIRDKISSYNYNSEENKSSETQQSFESVEGVSEMQESELSEPPNTPLLPFYAGYMGKSIKTAPEMNIVKSAAKLVLDIGSEMKNASKIPNEDTLSKYVILSALIRIMNLNEIEKVVEQVYSKEDYTEKGQGWKAFRDALAEAGTAPGLLAIQNLVANEKIKGEEAAEVVSAMAQSVREPTYGYVRSFYTFIIKPEIRAHARLNVTCLLRFSELINNVYVNKHYSHQEYPVHSFGSFGTKRGLDFVIKEYIPFLTEKLNSSVKEGDSHKIQVYISSLGSIGHPRILLAFKPYLEGQQQVSQYQRLHMVNSLEELVRNYPRIARNLLYKIYQNPDEHPDVRIAAVYQLARTGPSASMLQRMADYANIDKDQQVNSAVKSIILQTGNLKGSQYNYKSDNAKAARPFLPKQDYGAQYSHNYKKSFAGHEKTTFQYVASSDAYLPKMVRMALRSNFGGFSRQHTSIQAATSSVKDLLESLVHQFKEHLDRMEQQKAKSSEGESYRFSAENIVRMLNIDVEVKDQVEGSMLFKFGGYKRLLTVDKHTIEALPVVIKEIEEMLKEGNRFHFTKFFNGDQIAISFPTAMGLPFLYTYDVPTVVSLAGDLKINAHPEFSIGSQLNLPDTINSEGEINLLVSYKFQGQFGFIKPDEHKHYVSGYEKTGQIYVPFTYTLGVDRSNRKIRTKFAVQNPEENTRLISYRSTPYIGIYDILELKPGLKNPVGPSPKTRHNSDFGESMGVVLRVDYEGEDKLLDFLYLSQQIQQHNYAGIMSLWENQDMANRKLTVDYVGQESPNRKIIADVAYITKHFDVANQKCLTDEFFYNETKGVFDRLDDFVELAASRIVNASTIGIGVDVEFDGSKPVEYKTTLIYAKSRVLPISRVLFHINKQITTPLNKEYFVFGWVQNQMPSISEMNANKVLKTDVSSSTKVHFAFGADKKSSIYTTAYLNTTRTEDRGQYLKSSKLYQECQNEMQDGNRQLYACEKLTTEAKYADEVVLQLNPDKNGFSDRIYNWLRYHRYIGPDDDEGFNSMPDALFAEVYFSPDFTELNATVGTRKYESHKHFRLYGLEEPEENPITYWISTLLPEKSNKPSCIVDKTAVYTFDKLIYTARLSNSWTVLMLYTPSHAGRKQHLLEHMKSHNNYAILSRETASRQKEVKIYLRTTETKGDNAVVEFKPESDKLNVYFNGKQYKYNSGKSLNFYKNYIRVYLLTKGELKLDVKGEFSLLYDGYRLKIQLNSDRFYNDIRGLCGNSNFREIDEIQAPQSCALRTSDELLEAYTISDDVTPETPKKKPYKYGCYNYTYTFANVVSTKDSMNMQKRHNNEGCMRMQTGYQIKGNQVCFTINPLPRCQPECQPLKTISKIVDVFCVTKSKITDMWIAQIDKGANPDFDLKSTTKGVRFELQSACLRN